MVARIEYGKLKPHPEKISDPFDLLEWNKPISMSAWDFLAVADQYFRSETQCDCGSFYWKCRKSDLKRFSDEQKIELPDLLIETSDQDEYGVVFIEMP